MAHAAGADLADLEFTQFHPTALSAPGTKSDGLLVTEAVRGEGARLLGADGERFTDELAPRDAVTLAVLDQMKRDGTDHVLLDMRELQRGPLPERLRGLREAGLRPAARADPGGPRLPLRDGRDRRRSRGPLLAAGLFAVGECACTGLHGANRLASNSLTECFVLGAARGGRGGGGARGGPAAGSRPPWRFDPPVAETRDAVWDLAGPLRSTEALERLLTDPYPLARLIARFALEREESRGSHRRLEFPERDPALDEHHIVCAGDDLRWETWI